MLLLQLLYFLLKVNIFATIARKDLNQLMVVSLGMELLDHLGFRFQGEINVNNLWMKLKAIAIVNFLFLTVIFLNGLSIKFWILLKLFPDSTVNIQRLLQTLFWDFCLYLVVCI